MVVVALGGVVNGLPAAAAEEFSERQKRIFAGIVLLLIPLSGLCVDIYVPSLPAVAEALDATRADAQLTISTYVFGYGLGQLVAGPVSDAWGRKKPMILGALLHAAAVLWILNTSSIGLFIGLRALTRITLPARPPIHPACQRSSSSKYFSIPRRYALPGGRLDARTWQLKFDQYP